MVHGCKEPFNLFELQFIPDHDAFCHGVRSVFGCELSHCTSFSLAEICKSKCLWFVCAVPWRPYIIGKSHCRNHSSSAFRACFPDKYIRFHIYRLPKLPLDSISVSRSMTTSPILTGPMTLRVSILPLSLPSVTRHLTIVTPFVPALPMT